MLPSEVGAVVVTFHPDHTVVDNLRLLRHQVEWVVIVDNGSAPAELAAVRAIAAELGNMPLLENGINLGIATALNQGVQEVARRGFNWVILFDQDSTVTPGFMPAMTRCFAAHTAGAPLGILNPRYRDRRTQQWIPSPRAVPEGLEQATTSGSLMSVSIFRSLGWFADELFIDGVDHEYSLRVRAHGFAIAECAEAELMHSPGDVTVGKVGLTRFHAANYGPVRRFYQERNKVLLLRRYGRRFPGFFLTQFTISVKDVVKILLVENRKVLKLRFMLRGFLAGLLGRSGPLSDS